MFDDTYFGSAPSNYTSVHIPKVKRGHLGGFLDGHSAAHYDSELDIARQRAAYPEMASPSDVYWIELTVGGIKGWDVK